MNAIQENLINKYEKIISEIDQISDQSGTNGGKSGEINKEMDQNDIS